MMCFFEFVGIELMLVQFLSKSERTKLFMLYKPLNDTQIQTEPNLVNNVIMINFKSIS